MKKKKKGKVRWLSVLLAGCLLLSSVPATAFASEDTVPAKSENAVEETQMPEQQNATEESTTGKVTTEESKMEDVTLAPKDETKAADNGVSGTSAESKNDKKAEEPQPAEQPEAAEKSAAENTSNSVIEKAPQDTNAENKEEKPDKSNEKPSAEVSAYAAEYDFLPEGVTSSKGYEHTYHTQVDVTANVSVKASDGTVLETTQVSKSSGEFNFVTEEQISAESLDNTVENLQAEIEASYKAKGNVTREYEDGVLTLDHFDDANLYTFTPTSGDPVEFRTDLDAAKQYFREHPDATGTFTVTLDVHQYQKYKYSYDLTVQESSQPASVITAATIENAKFSYQPGDTPQATATVAAADQDKYEIVYETWQQFENNEPVAAWYSDNGSHGSLPTITEFESGKEYVYSLMLKSKDGYSFSEDVVMTVNGESVNSSLSGDFLYSFVVKTITPTKQTTAITSVDMENVKFDYQPGSAPQASAKQAGADQDKYDILFECWSKREKDADDTLTAAAYWYSDESSYSDGDVRFNTFEKGGRYQYSVRLQAKDGYTFDSNLSDENVTLNGASLPFGSWVNVLDDGKTCLITYGTETRPGQTVEEIRLDGAAINFTAGDKPRFSGVVEPYIDIDHQRWDANDGSGYGITSSDFWNTRYNGKLITEFEGGKSYTYGVYFKISDLGMEEGYRFDQNTKLYINGKEITLTPDQIDVDDNGETIWFSNVLTMTPTTVKVIDVVEINDVTVSFKDGDKPVFTGKSPEGVNYAYNCEWWELDSKTGAISADFFSGAYENKITTFEAGNTYHYGVYVKAVGYVEGENTTYVFGPNTKLKINGEFVNYERYEGDESDGSDSTMWVLTDLTMTPEAGGTTPAEKYTITYADGADGEEIFKDQTYTVESGKATPAFNGTPARDGYKFTGWSPAVTDTVTGNVTYTAQWEKLTPAEPFTVIYTDGVDNEEIFKDQTYTVESSKATPAFNGTPTRKGYTFTGWKPAVAATVTGNAIYEATWKSNSGTTTPSDDKSNTGETTNPKTGDTDNVKNSTTLAENKSDTATTPKTGDTSNIVLWIALLFVSSGALVSAMVIVKKKKYNR